MGKIAIPSRDALLAKLEPIRYEKSEEKGELAAEQMTLAGSLLLLAHINHDKEYQLCRSVAEHLLKTVPEPDDADFGDEP